MLQQFYMVRDKATRRWMGRGLTRRPPKIWNSLRAVRLAITRCAKELEEDPDEFAAAFEIVKVEISEQGLCTYRKAVKPQEVV